MPTPNLFLIYVTDVEVSTAFYRDLLEMEPDLITPRYVPFTVAPGILFALWSGDQESLKRATTRTSEVGLMVPGPAETVDAIFSDWMAKGATPVVEPHDDVFGRTFVVADPDGNYIRVSPVD